MFATQIQFAQLFAVLSIGNKPLKIEKFSNWIYFWYRSLNVVDEWVDCFSMAKSYCWEYCNVAVLLRKASQQHTGILLVSNTNLKLHVTFYLNAAHTNFSHFVHYNWLRFLPSFEKDGLLFQWNDRIYQNSIRMYQFDRKVFFYSILTQT